MCILRRNSKRKKVIGYKVVLKIRNGKYKSLAMGFTYPKEGFISIPEKQKRLSTYFINNILTDCNAYVKGMLGKTSVYILLKAARDLQDNIIFMTRRDSIKDKIVVIKIELTKQLVNGYYDQYHIVVGKHMKFIKEM